MTQTDSGHYNVVKDEHVTITVVAYKVNEDLAASLDGNTLNPSAHNPALYEFDVTKSVGAHFVDIACHFAAANPDDAYYQAYVQGSHGGGRFDGSSVRKKDADWDLSYQFSLP